MRCQGYIVPRQSGPTDFELTYDDGARLWVDGIVPPERTRETLLTALDVATRFDDGRQFKTGVLQV